MAREIVECVPNFSEGRRKEVVDRIAAAIARVPGTKLLDTEMDANHNRAVITFIGAPTAVAEAAFCGAREAVRLIDLTTHRGEHPRIGALDVCPFIPIRGVTMDDCVRIARAESTSGSNGAWMSPRARAAAPSARARRPA